MSQVESEKIQSQAARGKRMGYGAKSAAGVGSPSLDTAIASHYDRRDAGLRDDPERLAQSQVERRQFQAFAVKRQLAPSAVHQSLSVLREHELRQARRAEILRKDPKHEFVEVPIESRREGLRLAVGDAAASQELARNFVEKVATPLAAEVPSLARRFSASGAEVDPRLFLAFAEHVADPEPPKAA